VRFVTGSWYFLMLTAFLGICLDHALSLGIDSSPTARWLRMIGIAGLLWVTAPEVKSQSAYCMTNVDLAARELNRLSGPNDLIIVNAWSLGLPFDRYYHGPARWMTLPDIEDRRIIRFDLIKHKMTEDKPVAPLLAAIDQTLRSGARVFIVGTLLMLPPNAPRPDLPPAPQASTGWQELPYLNAWSFRVADHIRDRAQTRNYLPIPFTAPVRSQENVDLILCRDWGGPE
jgi:hypothetical protein